MTEMSRFTVSLPTRLLEAVDQKLVNGSESRSALVRRLLEQAPRDAQEREDVEQYIRGYTECPQTEEEFGWSSYAALKHFAEEPWE
jgi:metal-responsive CopG/Arc/MetJ family transcriptional regulator